ncbi:MAG TPA: tRNA (guanosine(46)-N7)-methyltransferase TrmB [Steroidobacteraceae bacterium]|jgi:tRNA (guanine-N7-)-methyltransferase
MRSVRSYVMRAGRITEAQQRALATLWPRFGIEFNLGPLDLDRLFGRQAPRTLEIGFGNGEHLFERALASPERDFVGVEVHRPGVGHLLLAAGKAEIDNLRVIAHDAVDVLQHQLSPGCLDEVQLLFPDPWPKARHHKRRLVQAGFVQLVATRLKPGGRLHLATDWEPYAEWMLEVLNGCDALRNCAADGGFMDQVMLRSATRFERRGQRLGHRIRELLFTR